MYANDYAHETLQHTLQGGFERTLGTPYEVTCTNANPNPNHKGKALKVKN
jgi:hypothetical protein